METSSDHFSRSIVKSMFMITFLSMCIAVTLLFILELSTGNSLRYDASMLDGIMMVCGSFVFCTLFIIIVISLLLGLFWLWRMTRAWITTPWKSGLIGAGSSLIIFGPLFAHLTTSNHGKNLSPQRGFIIILCCMLVIAVISFSHSFLTAFLYEKEMKKQAAKLAMDDGL